MLQSEAVALSLETSLHPQGERLLGEATYLGRDGMKAMPTT